MSSSALKEELPAGLHRPSIRRTFKKEDPRVSKPTEMLRKPVGQLHSSTWFLAHKHEASEESADAQGEAHSTRRRLLGLLNKVPGLGRLNHRHLFPHHSRGLKYEIRVPAELVSSEASLLSLQTAVFSLCLPCVCVCVLIASSYENTGHPGLGPTLTTSL